MNRRTFIKGGIIGSAASLLPIGYPIVRASESRISVRHIRYFQQIEQVQGKAKLRSKHPKRHMRQALERYEQIARLRRRFKLTEFEIGQQLNDLAIYSRPWIMSSKPSAINKVYAQTFVLDPIIVTAPPPPDFISFPEFSASLNFSSQSSYPGLLQYNSYINWYIPNRQNYLASLATQQPIPPPEPPQIIQPQPRYWSNEEDAFYGGVDAQRVKSEMNARQLDETQSLTALTAINAGLSLVEGSGVVLATTGMKLMAEGFAAGTVAAQVEFLATGIFVTLTGATMIALGLTAMYFTIYYLLPPLDRQLVLFGLLLPDYEVHLDLIPITPIVNPDPEPYGYRYDGTPVWTEQEWIDYQTWLSQNVP